MHRHAPLLIATIAALAGTGGLLGSANAQNVYKSVDRNGHTVYSDVPPAGAPPVAPNAGGNTAAATSSGKLSDGLTYTLRQTVDRYPVTLYAGKDCPPCDAARAMLQNRGVPFAERTVATNDDIEALKRLSGEGRLPLGTIGTKQLKGYNSTAWAEYLAAAGYAERITLPSAYRNGIAAPLTVPRPVATGASAPASEAAPVIPLYR